MLKQNKNAGEKNVKTYYQYKEEKCNGCGFASMPAMKAL
jgi:hypothetical protein